MEYGTGAENVNEVLALAPKLRGRGQPLGDGLG